MGCVRETPQIKLSQHGMCNRNSPEKKKKERNTGCVRETSPDLKKKNL